MRWIKSAWPWLVDQAIEHWPQIIWTAGAVAMTYFASAATWLNAYGPVAWGFVGLLTYLVLTMGYALYGVAKQRISEADFAIDRRNTNAINPLEDLFVKRQIKLADFFHPFYKSHKNRKFQDCEFYGPCAVLTLGHSTFDHCLFSGCEMVIVRNDVAIVGVTAFENGIFERCKFFRITFLMNKKDYVNWKKQAGQQMVETIPIISDGATGQL